MVKMMVAPAAAMATPAASWLSPLRSRSAWCSHLFLSEARQDMQRILFALAVYAVAILLAVFGSAQGSVDAGGETIFFRLPSWAQAHRLSGHENGQANRCF